MCCSPLPAALEFFAKGKVQFWSHQSLRITFLQLLKGHNRSKPINSLEKQFSVFYLKIKNAERQDQMLGYAVGIGLCHIVKPARLRSFCWQFN